MIILFGLEPKSAVVAFMVEKLKGTKASMRDPERKFFFDEVQEAERTDFGETYEEYIEKFGKIDFLEDPKLYEIVSGEIFWALRFGAIDRGTLVLKMIGKIQSVGSKAYLSEETPEAREMRFRVRRVLAEFNRALKYIKFTRFDDVKLSLAGASFENDIADMVLRAEISRCPDGYVAAISGDKTVSLLVNGTPYLGRAQKLPLSPERKGFKRFWGGLPESGGNLIWKDEQHAIREFPKLLLPKEKGAPEKVLGRQISTLDDFTG